MLRLAKSVSTRLAASHLHLQPAGRCAAFFSSEAPQMGARLTPDQIAERRAKRAERKAVAGDAAAEKSDALFIEGSVRPYKRHYVVVEPQGADPRAWPAKLERSPEHILSSYMGALAKEYGGDIAKVKKSPLLVTAAIPYTGVCSGALREAEESAEHVEEGAHDVMVFPDGVRVHNIVPSKISTLVANSLKEDLDLPALLEQENLQYTQMEDGYHMMVCGHAARDERCGCKGPELLEWLKGSAAEANRPLNLWTSSHYGGHRYAAACIVYPSGDWFGLLNEEEKAKGMIDAMNDEDPLRMYELWRGRMGLTEPEMHQAVKDRVEVPEEVAENA
ncbi:Thioredoxin-like fold [Phytophthora cinnamomi]|uniref:Thioredoxin-like fold n=1 Tax=Phytophthora cinnamomi TaxID=4785 RepID=UPI00355A4E01|nr:Thioredoxin-like fold [Phytophthora cinnamomi]